MRRAVVGLALTASLLAGGAGPAHASHRDRCRHECDDGGRYGDGGGSSGGDYGHGQGGDQDGRGNCHSFCNWTIPTPPLPGMGGGGQQPKQNVACLVPVPYHCDPAPQGFIPPNPGKIPQQIADFVKLVSDFVQGVIRFAV